jgi:hypothetical protein
VIYRALQFFRAMFAPVRAHEYELVEQLLSPAQAALFRRMARCDQRHGLDVLYALQKAGHQQRALLQAALLHDVGKAGSGLTIWHRVAVVLLQRLAPNWLARLAAGGRGWRAPFAAHSRHPQTGARWAASADCAPVVVDLIHKHHDTHTDDDLLVALQWADRQN